MTINTTMKHEDAFELLPWFVNQTLTEIEAERVQSHIETCEICADEVAFLNQLEAVTMEQPVHSIPSNAFNTVMRNIEQNETSVATNPKQSWLTILAARCRQLFVMDGSLQWSGVAMSIMLLAIVGMVSVQTGLIFPKSLQTLSSPQEASTGATKYAVSLKKNMNEAEFNEVLLSISPDLKVLQATDSGYTIVLENNPKPSQVLDVLSKLKAYDVIENSTVVFD